MGDHVEQIEIPPRGKKGSWAAWGMRFARLFEPRQIARYRKEAGSAPPMFLDFPLVLLTTVGTRTGREVTHPLGGFEQPDGTWLVVASKGGASTHPRWFINLAKHPDNVWLEVGNRKLKVRPTLLKGVERETALARIATISPRYAEYQRKTDRQIPIVRLTPA